MLLRLWGWLTQLRLSRWLWKAECSWLLAMLRRLSVPKSRNALSSGQLARRSTIVAAIAFLGGLAFAWAGNFVESYVWKTGLVWFAVIGIGWVTYWGGWADERLRSLEEKIEPAFKATTDDTYNNTYSRGLTRMYRRLWPILLSLPLIGVLWAYVAWAALSRGSFTVLPPSWTNNGHRWFHVLALWWLIVPGSLLMMTMLKGARDFGYLVRQLSAHPLALPTELARLRLRPLVGWGIATGFGWTLALSVLIFVFRFIPAGSGGTPHGAGLVGPIAFMMFAAFWATYYLVLVPQFALHKTLQNSKIRLLQACAERIWPNGSESSDPLESAREHIGGLLRATQDETEPEQVMRGITSEPEWVYPAPGELLLFATQAILPVIALVVSVSVHH